MLHYPGRPNRHSLLMFFWLRSIFSLLLYLYLIFFRANPAALLTRDFLIFWPRNKWQLCVKLGRFRGILMTGPSGRGGAGATPVRESQPVVRAQGLKSPAGLLDEVLFSGVVRYFRGYTSYTCTGSA